MSDLKIFIKDTISIIKMDIEEIKRTHEAEEDPYSRGVDDGQMMAFKSVIALLSHVIN